MSEENKKLVRRFVEEIENQGKLDLLDEMVAGDFINHTPLGETHGIAAGRQFGTMLLSAFPDMHVTVEDEVADGDRVATRWVARGTHRGEFQGIPATGRQMEITGMTMTRIANGKIVEQWGNPDLLGLMQQLGLVRAPGQAD